MKHALFASTVALALAACLPGAGADGDDVIAGDWILTRPASTEVAPGQILALRVTGVDTDAENIRLWVGDIAYPIMGATADGDAIIVREPVPVLHAGPLEVALGTDSGVKTGTLALDVVVPPSQYTKAEAAQLLASGYRAIVDQVRTALDDPDPAVQAWLADTYGANLAPLRDAFTELATATDMIAADYMAIPDADEPAAQAILAGTGLLGILADTAALSTDPTKPGGALPADGVVTLLDRLNHPIARVLYTLDLTSALLGNISDLTSILNIIAAFTPGAQPIALVGFEAKLVIAVIRGILDCLVPTDLVQLEPADQPVMFTRNQEPAKWMYWGTFQPTNGVAGGLTFVVDQIYALFLNDHLCPPGLKSALDTVARDLYSRVLRIIPNAIGRLQFSPTDKARFTRVKILVNMQAYDLTLGDLALLVPMMGPMLKELSWLLDYEVASPFTTTDGATDWLADAELRMDYAEDRAYLSEIPLPGDTSVTGDLTVTASAYRWKPYWIGILSLPAFERIPVVEHHVHVRWSSEPGDPNDVDSDEAWIVTSLAPAIGGPAEATIWDDTTSERTVNITVHDHMGPVFGGTAEIALVINGQPRNIVLGGDQQIRMYLAPGRNTISVRALAGYVTPESNGYHVSIKLTVPDALNADKSDDFFLNVGDEQSKVIWTPPRF